ncbi:MAG: hypothetical protein AAF936_15610 [Pseudomonadota bacterium]
MKLIMKIDRGKVYEAPQTSASDFRDKAPEQKTSRMSYSYTQRDKLPGAQPAMYSASPEVGMNFQNERDPLIAAQTADLKKTEAQRRESFMVKRQKPQPVLRPSPRFAFGPDRNVFNAQLAAERLEAARFNKKTAREEGRKSTKAQLVQEHQQAAPKTRKRKITRSR